MLMEKSQMEALYKAIKMIWWLDGHDYTVNSRNQSKWKNWSYWTVTPRIQFPVTLNTYQKYEIWIIHRILIQMKG